jgi:hypothetical protein
MAIDDAEGFGAAKEEPLNALGLLLCVALLAFLFSNGDRL